MRQGLTLLITMVVILAAASVPVLGGDVQTMQFGDLKVVRLDLGGNIANCYVVSSPAGEAYIIDPGGNTEKIVSYVKSERLKVIGYLVTHAHYDHIDAFPRLVDAIPAAAYIHSADIPLYRKRMANSGPFSQFLEDGKHYGTGALSFTIIHTPGHSQGSVCIYFRAAGVLFTGDTLFADGVGRTDFYGGSSTDLNASLKKLAALPSRTILLPGHGPATSIGKVLPEHLHSTTRK